MPHARPLGDIWIAKAQIHHGLMKDAQTTLIELQEFAEQTDQNHLNSLADQVRANLKGWDICTRHKGIVAKAKSGGKQTH